MDMLLKDMKSDAGRAYSACLLALPQTSLKRLPPYVGTKFIEFIIFFVWVALKDWIAKRTNYFDYPARYATVYAALSDINS